MKKEPKSPQEIWEQLQGKLPDLNKEEQQEATNKWLLHGAKDSSKMEAHATAKAIFDDEFYQKSVEEAGNEAKRPLLRQLWAATTAIAAMLALGFYLYSMQGPSDAYPYLMAQANAQTSTVTMLGGNYEVYPDLSKLPSQQSGEGFIKIAIPENTAIVAEIGQKNGVNFYKVQQGEHTYTVLSSQALPKVGEYVSFNAKLFWVSGLFSQTPVMVEEVRHEVFE